MAARRRRRRPGRTGCFASALCNGRRARCVVTATRAEAFRRRRLVDKKVSVGGGGRGSRRPRSTDVNQATSRERDRRWRHPLAIAHILRDDPRRVRFERYSHASERTLDHTNASRAACAAMDDQGSRLISVPPAATGPICRKCEKATNVIDCFRRRLRDKSAKSFARA